MGFCVRRGASPVGTTGSGGGWAPPGGWPPLAAGGAVTRNPAGTGGGRHDGAPLPHPGSRAWGYAAASAAPARTLDQIIAERSSQPIAEEPDQPADPPTEPVLPDFESESDVPRAVKVVPPPPRTWNRTLAAAAAIVLVVALIGGASLYVYAEARAADTVIVLPAPPKRPPLPALSTPAIPKDLLPPGAN